MKIRNGFVSNSSSSSFIIKQENYPDIATIAKIMIITRGWKQNDANLIEKIDDLLDKKVLLPNSPVTFPTCNYDTFILLKEKYYFIATCNNHQFYDLPYFINNVPHNSLDIIKAEDFEDIDRALTEHYAFFNLQQDLWLKENGWCDVCGQEKSTIIKGVNKGKIICACGIL